MRFAAWASDLPNRIAIDEEALGQAIGSAVTSSYHQGLSTDDEATKRKILRSFSEYAASEPSAKSWIAAEFSKELEVLAQSEDAAIAQMARELQTDLDVPPAPVAR